MDSGNHNLRAGNPSEGEPKMERAVERIWRTMRAARERQIIAGHDGSEPLVEVQLPPAMTYYLVEAYLLRGQKVREQEETIARFMERDVEASGAPSGFDRTLPSW